MADLAIPILSPLSSGYVQGRGVEIYRSTGGPANVVVFKVDFRHPTRTDGVISDRVVLKSGAAELAFENARVWLLRESDGYKAWTGWSDANGDYRATGLEVGVAYIPIAVDRLGNQKAVAAGPVVAVAE